MSLHVTHPKQFEDYNDTLRMINDALGHVIEARDKYDRDTSEERDKSICTTNAGKVYWIGDIEDAKECLISALEWLNELVETENYNI